MSGKQQQAGAAAPPPPAPWAWARGEPRPQFLRGPLLHEQFYVAAAAQPQAVCLVDDASGTALTYGQVAEGATTLARTLARLGVGLDMAVGILVDRSPGVVVAMLGVLKSGGFYVPLDPSYQADRLAGYIEDSKAPVIITQAVLVDQANELATAASVASGAAPPTVLLIEDILAGNVADVAGGKDVELPTLNDNDLCYCMFTSGSTGRPKGVEVTHGGLRDLIAFFVEKMKLTSQDVFCLNTTVCFDPYVLYLYGSLAVGGRLVIPKPDGHVDADYMAQLCLRHNISILEVVPSLAAQYVRDLKPLGSQLKIRRFLTGGEALSAQLSNSVYDALPGCECVWNTYGPTEVTVQVVTGAIPRGATRVPLGRPDFNVHTYVSTFPNEENGETMEGFKARACGVGEPGELLLSGPRLGRGYRGRPDLTADKFIPNPFYETTADLAPDTRQYYQLVYRTGDLVRWAPDGQLDFLGRIDRQVKVNGVRIELAEIEAALAAAPNVHMAAAVAWKDARTGNYRLAGYVVPSAGVKDPSAVASGARETCASRLVPAMVPSVVVPMDAFKVLPNGKCDTKSLPEPDWAGLVSGRSYTAPRDDLEAALASIWEDALEVPPAAGEDTKIGTNDDFFELGGTSLLAGRINSDVRRKLGVDMSSLVIFQARNIASMASAIRPLVERKKQIEQRKSGLGSADTSSESGGSSTEGEHGHHNGMAKGQTAAVHGKPFPMWFATTLQITGYVAGHVLSFIVGLGPVIGLLALYAYTDFSMYIVLAMLPAIVLGIDMIMLLACIAFKWCILGRQRPGTYPLWGWQYIRWWTVRAISGQVATSVLPALKGSEILNIFQRCMGAKIGKKVQLDSGLTDWDLITIGDDVIMESNVLVSGSSVAAGDSEQDPGTINFGPVEIGAHCTLGSQSCVSPGTIMAPGSVLKPGTATSHPSSLAGKGIDGLELRTASPLPIILQIIAILIAVIVSTYTWLLSVLPSAMLWWYMTIYEWDDLIRQTMDCWTDMTPHGGSVCTELYVKEVISVLILPATMFFVGQLYLVFLWAYKWIFLGRMTPKKSMQTNLWWRFRVHIWKVLQDLPIYRQASDPWTGTELFNAYMRSLGAKVGRQCWLGERMVAQEPDMLQIGDYVSVCSAVSVMCTTEARSAPVILKDSCAVTNESVLLPGVTVHPEAVLGVYSLGRPGQVFAPDSITQGEVVLRPGKDLECGGDDKPAGINPKAVSNWIYWRANVLYWLATIIIVPLTMSVHDLPMLIVGLTGLYFGGIWLGIVSTPIACALGVAILMLYMALLKALLLRCSAGSHPLYGYRAGCWQMLGILGYVYDDFRDLMGSQVFVWYLRLMGARVGKNVCILGSNCVELDQVSIGDGTVINEMSFIMGHTVENRAVKIGRVTIGKRCTLGSMAAVLPGAVLADGCIIGDMSLVMKNELVPAGAVWCGIPAVPVDHYKLSKLSYETSKFDACKGLSDRCSSSDGCKFSDRSAEQHV